MPFAFDSKPKTQNAKRPESPLAIRVVGVGNPLMGDDGIGIAVVERLEREGVQAGVEVIDGGTGGLTLLTLMEGARAVVLVDALEMGRTPGTVIASAYSEWRFRIAGSGLSLHQAGLAEVLALGAELGELPEVFVVGIQPAVIAMGQELSAAVAAALPEAVAAVRSQLYRWLQDRR